MLFSVATVKDIADRTGLAPITVMRWSDKGLISARKDFRGRRFFDDPEATIKEILNLLNIKQSNHTN